jgi:hypothetical protein
MTKAKKPSARVTRLTKSANRVTLRATHMAL